MLSRLKILGFIVAILGLALVVLGVLWMTVLYPNMAKLKADFDEVTKTCGSVTLLDSDTQQPVEYDVLGTRQYTAVKCTSDVIYLNEDITFVDANTGDLIPDLDSHILLAIDRQTRANVPGHGDRDRDGYWSPPAHLEFGKGLPTWVTGNPMALTSNFIGEEDCDGLRVFVYELVTPDEGIRVPATLFEPEMTLHQHITGKIEPISGTPIYTESITKLVGTIPVPDELFPNTGELTFTEVTLYEDTIYFTEEQEAKLFDDAKYFASGIPMAEVTIPAILIGLGSVLTIVAAFLIARRRRMQPQTSGEAAS